jgi:hypothetical protein
VSSKRLGQRGFALLELLLLVALLMIICQAFPDILFKLCAAMSFRNWSRGAWIALNVGTLLTLFAIRFHLRPRSGQMAIRSALMTSRQAPEHSQQVGAGDERNARIERDTEWRERARKRLPFT